MTWSRVRGITKSGAFDASDKLALVDGDIGEAATATRIAETAQSKFGSIDALVNNASIYFSKPFTDYKIEDWRALASVNIEGFLFITQHAIEQMLVRRPAVASSISRPRWWITRSPE
jgi:NADP-dependent 3-hydroxy acid dehydrogenase YdfG